MPPKKKTSISSRTTSVINIRQLEKLIQDSVRSEMGSQQSRRRTTEAYTQRLHETDTEMAEFIQQAITETTHTYRLTVNSYIASYFAAFSILIAGLVLLFLGNRQSELYSSVSLPAALIFVASGLIWMLSLQSRSPVKHNRQMVNHLAKLNVVFASYIRQIHQVDTLFEELVEGGEDINPQVAEQLLNNLQDAMTEAMNAISIMANELDD